MVEQVMTPLLALVVTTLSMVVMETTVLQLPLLVTTPLLVELEMTPLISVVH